MECCGEGDGGTSRMCHGIHERPVVVVVGWVGSFHMRRRRVVVGVVDMSRLVVEVQAAVVEVRCTTAVVVSYQWLRQQW